MQIAYVKKAQIVGAIYAESEFGSSIIKLSIDKIFKKVKGSIDAIDLKEVGNSIGFVSLLGFIFIGMWVSEKICGGC